MVIVSDAQTDDMTEFCHVSLQTIFSVFDDLKAWLNKPKPKVSKGMCSRNFKKFVHSNSKYRKV